MIDLLQGFLLYNLLPAVLAGMITWLLVYAALSVFQVEYGTLRLSLLAAPLVKSLLVLFGIGLVLPWPRPVFAAWHARALSFSTVLPIVLIWGGAALILRTLLVRRARRLALQGAKPVGKSAPRLAASIDRVHAAYRRCPQKMVGRSGLACCVNVKMPQPRLLVSNRGLRSPTILTSESRPVIIFPRDLVERLSDDELDRALAHEYAHFLLRSHCGVSSTNLRRIVPINPIASLVAALLVREEEKACDDMAVAALGKPDVYADMLLKSYRFSAAHAGPLMDRVQVLPQLLGVRPMITERVERQLGDRPPQSRFAAQMAATCLLWTGLIFLFQV